MKRFLVTTALEKTWGENVPVLFLGEWCRLYNRKHIWSKMDALVAQPYGVQPDEELRDAAYLDDLAINILTELTEVLNRYHQVQYSERYWNIVLGHWLKRYVSVAFNRYYTIEQALKNYEVTGTDVFMGAEHNLVTPNSSSFIYACGNDQWNHAFFSRVMSFRGDIELNQVLAPLGGGHKFGYEKKRVIKLIFETSGMKEKLQIITSLIGTGIFFNRLLKRLLDVIGPMLSRDTDAFVISSYLPIKEDIKLHFALRQVPRLWKCPPFKQVDADPEQRASLKLNYDHFEAFEKYVRWQLPEVIPTCYLEGYKDLIAAAEKTIWPKTPKFIFTSNCFDTDEVFKVWTALKVEQGTSYFTGQHGFGYGAHNTLCTRHWPERVTSDKFLTWGWKETEKDFPSFVFTCAGRTPKSFDSAGGLLSIAGPLEKNMYSYDPYHKFILNIEAQFQFVGNLPEPILQRLTVRLHAAFDKLRSFEELRWRDHFPDVKVDQGLTGIRKLIKQSRLVVYTYDSTGILETLAMNIPTICFWPGGLNHLLPVAKPYYELLADAGILFYSPEKAANSIALHWNDISGWWESKKVQDARQEFCEQYARTVANPARELKTVLLENL